MKTAYVCVVDGTWYYALWIDGEYDHDDELAAQTAAQARAEVLALWPDADVQFEGGR